jgi:predicted nucleic-acid-binding Zn-ribbon protein
LRDGLCPKCGSEEVYSGVDAPQEARHNSIPIKGNQLWMTFARLSNYVCVSCGYVESYIADERKLEDIARNWPRARP